MASSFRKKTSAARGQGLPLGSKASFHNNQLLVSSGVPSLDIVLGGGIPLGSLLLVEEDTYNTFSNLLLRYFVAEGVLCKHGLVLLTADENADNIIKRLPAPLDQDTSQQEQNQKENQGKESDELKIAWRYKNVPSVQESSIKALQFGHYYDLTKIMGEESLSAMDMKCLYVNSYQKKDKSDISTNNKIHPAYKKIVKDLQEIITQGNYSTSSTQHNRNILRVAIQSLGSPLWPTNEDTTSLTWLLVALRAVLRSALAVCVVTVPPNYFDDPVLMRRMEQCADNAVYLESFAGSEKEKNPVFKDYDGLLHIKKKGRINCIAGQEIDISDWAFKLKRKKFAIEKLHLPPDLSETANRAQLDTKKIEIQSGQRLCGAGGRSSNTSIDF